MKLRRRSFVAGLVAAGALPALPLRAQTAPYSIPLRLTDRRVLVDCLLEGRGPYPLVIDTGGAFGLLDEQMVDALGLKSVGSSYLGIGGQRRKYDFFSVMELDLGGVVKQPDSLFARTSNVNFLDGAVGSLHAGTLTAMDSELDFAASVWRLYPQGGPMRDGWMRIDNALETQDNGRGSAWLFASVGIAGQDFRIGLDTGSPSELRLSGKALKATGLWDSPRWTPGSPRGEGRIVRIPELRFGGVVLRDVIANLHPESQWDEFENGLIGLQVLRRFDIATQPAQNTLYLRRNALADPAPRYNRAGIWVERKGDDLEVAVIGAGSPASLAGIKPGDRLLGARFEDIIERFDGPAGTVLPLSVKAGKTTRQVDLVLADFL